MSEEKLPDLVGKTVSTTYYEHGEVLQIAFTDGAVIEISERMTGGQLGVSVMPPVFGSNTSTALTTDELTMARAALLKWKYELRQNIAEGKATEFSTAVLGQVDGLRRKLHQMRAELEGNAQ